MKDKNKMFKKKRADHLQQPQLAPAYLDIGSIVHSYVQHFPFCDIAPTPLWLRAFPLQV